MLASRRKRVVALVAVAGLALAACGVKATIDQAISSLGSSPYLQVHLTARASGPSSGQADQVLKTLSVDMRYASPGGDALADSAGRVNTEIVVNVGAQSLVDLRLVASNVYVLVNVSSIANIPGVHVSSQELAAAQLLIGGRWFELPATLLQQLANQAHAQASPGQQAATRAGLQQIVGELSAVIENTPYTTVPGGGFRQTGSLQSVVQAIVPGLTQLTGRPFDPGHVQGSYTLGLTMSGATATGGSIEISAPDRTGGNESVELDATVAHNQETVEIPGGVTVITPSLLQMLEQQGMGFLYTS